MTTTADAPLATPNDAHPPRRSSQTKDRGRHIDQALEDFICEETRRRFEIASIATFVTFAVAWTVGRIVLSGQSLERPGRVWLGVLCVAAAASVVVFRYAPTARRHPVAFGALFHAVVAWGAASHVTLMSDLDGPFFYSVYAFPTLAIGLPIRPAPRVLMTLIGAVVYVAVYFGKNPSYLDHPMIHVPFVYLFSVVLISYALGHHVYRLIADRFVFGRELSRQKAVIEKHATWLEGEVQERTNVLDDVTEALHQMARERAEVARDLHDDLGQLVVGVKMQLSSLEGEAGAGAHASDDEDRVEHLTGVVERMDSAVRGFIERLRAPQEIGPLREVIPALGAEVPGEIDIRSEVSLDAEPTGDTRRLIYRIVQEALTNALKHGQPKKVWIRVFRRELSWVATVRDDGCGFDEGAESQGWGVRGMRERAAAAGGELQVRSGPEGTTVELSLPADATGTRATEAPTR